MDTRIKPCGPRSKGSPDAHVHVCGPAEVPPDFFNESDEEDENPEERISGACALHRAPCTRRLPDTFRIHASPPPRVSDRQRDRHIVPDEELSDSDDEGMGGRRNQHSFAAGPAASAAASAAAAGSSRPAVSTRRGKVTASGPTALSTDTSAGAAGSASAASGPF